MHTHGQDSPQGPDPTWRAHRDQRGERDFEDWVNASADQLMRTALFLTGERHQAEDLLQDVLERTYLHWRRVNDPAAYARTVMARAVTDRWRRLGRRPREVTLDALWPEQSQGNGGAGALSGHHASNASNASRDHAERYAEQDEVVTALRQLSPRQRAVLVLRYYEDFTEAQIADALNCSTGTVKTQASRGLARLRHLLGTSPADPPDATAQPAPQPAPQPATGPAQVTHLLPLPLCLPLSSHRSVPSPEERTR
ncbi:SigE family RNA polymerase sigma factor [Kineococcus sp. SYSU DK005]|uniref:SigE family RNA polymerase sigma factor n=1 Tax=Kineococcus sp. SYSU DK005 TaxID=3383126 RepID=UPI003D7CD06B